MLILASAIAPERCWDKQTVCWLIILATTGWTGCQCCWGINGIAGSGLEAVKAVFVAVRPDSDSVVGVLRLIRLYIDVAVV